MRQRTRRYLHVSGLAALLLFLPGAYVTSSQEEHAALEEKGFVKTVGLGNLSFIFRQNDVCYAGSVTGASKALFLLIRLRDGTLLYGFQTADKAIQPGSTYKVQVGFHESRNTYVPGKSYTLHSVANRRGIRLVAGIADQFIIKHLKNDMMIHFNDVNSINEHFRIEDIDLALDELETCSLAEARVS